MTTRNKSPETFQSLQKRNWAVEVLQSYEKLSWYSYHRCESLFQTRQHFQNIVAGLDHLEPALVDWKQDNTPHKKSNDKTKSQKATDRHSSGSASKTKGSSKSESASTDQNLGKVECAPTGSRMRPLQPTQPIEID